MILSALVLIPSVLAATLINRVDEAAGVDSSATSDTVPTSAGSWSVPTASTLTAAQICAALNQFAPDQVFYPGEGEYVAQSYHYFTRDNITSTCLVEPKTSAEVSILMQIISKFKPQWAVRGRGHNHNYGFSGTTGILISTARFNGTTINANNTVSAGTGLKTTQVYDAVASTGKTIIGGRTNGPGIAGVTGGGGMSWLVNEHGLAIDGLDSAELVTPSGAIKQLSATQNTDLWWAIRGGGNRFGILTRLTFTLYPIGNVCGGTYFIGGDGNKTRIYEAGKALAAFDAQQNSDPKASINWILISGPGVQPAVVVNYFYNAPAMPASAFSMFFAIPNVPQASSAVVNTPYNVFVANTPQPQYNRSCQNTIPIRKHTETYMKTAIDLFYDALTTSASGGKSLNTLLWVFEPFVSSWISHSKGGSWPHETDPTSAPTWYLIWDKAADDDYFQNKLRSITTTARNQALSEGIINTSSPLYSNYLSTTQGTVDQVYQQNLPRLKQIYAANDPNGVMQLTGGWNLL